MSDIFGMNDLSTGIMELIGDSQRLISEVEEESPQAAQEAAEIIAQEQRRILSHANFKRDKPKHAYNHVGGGVIKVFAERSEKRKTSVFAAGFDTDTLRLYPELIEIEFGRPGKSPREFPLQALQHQISIRGRGGICGRYQAPRVRRSRGFGVLARAAGLAWFGLVPNRG